MIVANKTSYEICNKLGSCKNHAGDEIDHVFDSLQQTHLVLNDEKSEEDDVEFQDENAVEDDGEVDYSLINNGGVEPDYEFHENRVGNDDSHDNDNNEELSKKRPVSLCHLCHQVVGFVIHHTQNRTSKVRTSLEYSINS